MRLNCTILSPALWSSELFWGSYCCKQACASHIWFCAGVFNEGRTLHAAPVTCLAVVTQMAVSSHGLVHTRFTTVCSLLDLELCMSAVRVVACIFKVCIDTILLGDAW